MVDRVGAPYRVLLYQPGIRFIHLSNSKGLCLQHTGLVTGLSESISFAYKHPEVHHIQLYANCYDLKLKGLSNKTTLVLSNTRELDRVPSTE